MNVRCSGTFAHLKKLRAEATDRLVEAARLNPDRLGAELKSTLQIEGTGATILPGTRWASHVSGSASGSSAKSKAMQSFCEQTRKKKVVHMATQDRRSAGEHVYTLSTVKGGSFKEVTPSSTLKFSNLGKNGGSVPDFMPEHDFCYIHSRANYEICSFYNK